MSRAPKHLKNKYAIRCRVETSSDGLCLHMMHDNIQFYVGELTQDFEYVHRDGFRQAALYVSIQSPLGHHGYYDRSRNEIGLSWYVHDVRPLTPI